MMAVYPSILYIFKSCNSNNKIHCNNAIVEVSTQIYNFCTAALLIGINNAFSYLLVLFRKNLTAKCHLN